MIEYATLIDTNPFKKSGNVDTIEFFAGISGQPLHFGIYRQFKLKSQYPTSRQLELIQQIKFPSVQRGYNKVNLQHKEYKLSAIFTDNNNIHHFLAQAYRRPGIGSATR